MTVSGIFIYTQLNDTTAGLGTGNKSVDGNGFVNKTQIKGVVNIPSSFENLRVISILSYAIRKCHLMHARLLYEDLS